MPDRRRATRVNAYIGIGSNLDNPKSHVIRGLGDLEDLTATCVVGHSSLYVSPPMGPPQQPDYVNAIVSLHTALEPLALLDALQSIERAHRRVRDGEQWGPRTLDLDILLYGDRQIQDERLVVPHPGLHERAFVLYPLLELANNIEIPGRGPLCELVKHCPRGDLRRVDIA